MQSASKVAKLEKDLNKINGTDGVKEDESHVSEANQALKKLKEKISKI